MVSRRFSVKTKRCKKQLQRVSTTKEIMIAIMSQSLVLTSVFARKTSLQVCATLETLATSTRCCKFTTPFRASSQRFSTLKSIFKKMRRRPRTSKLLLKMLLLANKTMTKYCAKSWLSLACSSSASCKSSSRPWLSVTRSTQIPTVFSNPSQTIRETKSLSERRKISASTTQSCSRVFRTHSPGRKSSKSSKKKLRFLKETLSCKLNPKMQNKIQRNLTHPCLRLKVRLLKMHKQPPI